jgi:NAD(P)-dependent dehydrogenase (short-subunit alcohol dehydrogenase family)
MTKSHNEQVFSAPNNVAPVTGGTSGIGLMPNFTMGRCGAIEDAAGLTIFRSSKAGSFLTGVVIHCNGGATAIG